MDEQGNDLFDSLKFLVANLRNSEVLEKNLKGLGNRHLKYGVLPQHYFLVGNSVIKTLAGIPRDGKNPQVKQAWVDPYTALKTVMVEGADYPVELFKLTEE